MTYPQHPDTIIIKNKYYPNGLREIDIWNYYQKNKNNLLRETLGKVLIVFFATEINEVIVLRKNKSERLIRLNPSNYDQVISGRTLSFHSVMDKYSNYAIIDIDTDNFEDAKNAAFDIYNILNKAKFLTDLKIRFTGKTSFHIKADFNGNYPIDYIKKTITQFLISNGVENKYTISGKRTKKIPNIDLNRNVYNAGYITLYSLSVIGLKCMEVSIRNLKNFRKEMSKIDLKNN